MVKFATPEFFQALVDKLNEDPQFHEKTGSIKADLLFVTNDRPDGALVKVDHGKASLQVVPHDSKAEFTFFAPYETWIKNHQGEPLDKMIMTGKVKFKGSIPKIMILKNQLLLIDQTAKKVQADY